jgi:tripartite-type tricarboxylate transporter receptor subunit TctC
MAQTPDIPTLTELGAELELTISRGIVMPQGAPDAAQATLESALMELSQDETFVQQVNNAGAEVAFRGQEDYTAYLASLAGTVERLAEVLAP